MSHQLQGGQHQYSQHGSPQEQNPLQLEPQALPQPQVQQRVYQVGDVANGHRFNGVEWVPVDGTN